MSNILLKIQMYIKQNPILVTIFVILEILIIILLIISFQNVFHKPEGVSNTEIPKIQQEIKDLPEDSIKVIQAALFETIVENKGNISSLPDSEVQIRQDSTVNLYFEKINIHYVNFIVDIPSVKQSYQVFREWSDDGANKYYLDNRMTLIMCLPDSQAIYPDFQCQDKYNHNGQAFVVSEFLPYLDLDDYNIYIQYDKAPYIIIIAPDVFNVDDDTKNTYIEQTKEKVASLGFSADAFSYYVSYGPEDPGLFLEYIMSNN